MMSSSSSMDPRQIMEEGSSIFRRELDEIEEMGGDPFFFTAGAEEEDAHQDDVQGNDDDNDAESLLSSSFLSVVNGVTSISDIVEERYATDGKGPTPSKKPSVTMDLSNFEWDGTVDDEAHFDLD